MDPKKIGLTLSSPRGKSPPVKVKSPSVMLPSSGSGKAEAPGPKVNKEIAKMKAFIVAFVCDEGSFSGAGLGGRSSTILI